MEQIKFELDLCRWCLLSKMKIHGLKSEGRVQVVYINCHHEFGLEWSQAIDQLEY